MESNLQVPQSGQTTTNPGCLSEISWFFSGAVLPMGSLAFYRKAIQKSVGSAILFFFVFTSIIACLLTISFGIGMFSVSSEIQSAYASGQIPEIVIAGGVAQVDGPQPVILLDDKDNQGNRILAAVDTTGGITSIDKAHYDQGFLLTRTELHILNRGEYQKLPLSEMNALFEQDPLIIDASTVTQAWEMFSAIFMIIALIGLGLWHVAFRLMIVAMYALIIWGIVSLIRPNTGFGPIIINGLYAIVPAIYISHLFSRVDFSFPGLQTFFLFVFWAIGLFASLMNHPFLNAERPLRLWTAFIGVPMLILIIVDSIQAIPDPYGPIALWLVTIITILALAGTRLFFRYKESQPSSTTSV
jgi:hypothetical protein